MKFQNLKTLGLSTILAVAALGAAPAYAGDGGIPVNHDAVDIAAQSWIDIQQAEDHLDANQPVFARAELRDAIRKLSKAVQQDPDLNFKFTDQLSAEMASQEVLEKLQSIEQALAQERPEQAKMSLKDLPLTDS